MMLAFRSVVLAVLLQAIACGTAHVAELDPAAVAYKLPDQIQWKALADYPGIETSVVAGDPLKAGLYVIMVRFHAGNHFSRPHFHPHDRFITVLQGTWWVGSGTKFDPDATVPMPAGSFVTHFGQQVHFDGAKDEDVILVITGEGPGTVTPAETK
jgi:quercetin dioxygenase-like cupin family protein